MSGSCPYSGRGTLHWLARTRSFHESRHFVKLFYTARHYGCNEPTKKLLFQSDTIITCHHYPMALSYIAYSGTLYDSARGLFVVVRVVDIFGPSKLHSRFLSSEPLGCYTVWSGESCIISSSVKEEL